MSTLTQPTLLAPLAALSIKIDSENPDHHLWNNHGTWWIHYTVHQSDYTKRRVRVSLETRTSAKHVAAETPSSPTSKPKE